MTITLLAIGKTSSAYLQEGIREYEQRLRPYMPFEITIVADVRNARSLPREELLRKEGEVFMAHLKDSDYVVLFDENGAQFTSVEFSAVLQKRMNAGTRRLVFVIGGAYGFSDAMRKRANQSVSLSPMTFSHQMVRLIAAEQLYRAFTILRGEPYHHE